MQAGDAITLPEPARASTFSIEQALAQRRSVRSFAPRTLSLAEISQLAWAAQGVTRPVRGFRTAPSAGATFPIEVRLMITGTPELDDGVYRYLPDKHALQKTIDGDLRSELHAAAYRQAPVGDAPVVMVITGVIPRTESRYGHRAERYVHMEAGHVSQNVYLQSTALRIGTVVVGAFRDRRVASVLQLADDETPLYIMPLGRMN